MKAETKKEKDLLDLLDIIILKMMLIEKIENFQIENHYNKMQIKNVLKKALKTIGFQRFFIFSDPDRDTNT